MNETTITLLAALLTLISIIVGTIPIAYAICSPDYARRFAATLRNLFRRPPRKDDPGDMLLRLIKEKSAMEQETFESFKAMIHALCRAEGVSLPDEAEILALFDELCEDLNEPTDK
jgi:hypothetical protein